MNINTTKYALPIGEFVMRSAPAQYDRITLHFTAGSTAGGAYAGWITDRDPAGNKVRVATPYIIDRDEAASVYQLFSPATGWAWHIGGTNVVPTEVNTRSLGIEVVNIGKLTLDPDGKTLRNYLGKVHCTLDQKALYVKHPVWRGVEYWQPFTVAQLGNLKALVHMLCDQWNIPLVILPADIRMSICNKEACTFKGIVSHHNYLGKTDVGPLVNQEWLITK